MAVPTPTELKIRYREFATVEDEVVSYWITDAQRIVRAAWGDDEAIGLMSLAAHNMKLAGYGSEGAFGAMTGVTDFKSASYSASFDADTVRASAAGGYGSTRYGREFEVLLRRQVGGPRLIRCA